jgi:hypothetical protein
MLHFFDPLLVVVLDGIVTILQLPELDSELFVFFGLFEHIFVGLDLEGRKDDFPFFYHIVA